MRRLPSPRGLLRCAPLVLPPDGGLRREITRPPEYRQDGFDAEFDATTLFYDVVALGTWPSGNLVLIGPPLRNLESAFLAGRVNDRPLGPQIVAYHQRDRCSDIWLSAGLGTSHDDAGLGGMLTSRSSVWPKPPPKRDSKTSK